MLLLSDPQVAAILVRDCGEALVDLREGGRFLVDTRKKDPAGSWARVRVGLRDRLRTAQDDLPDGVRLLVVEGHRPVELQQHYFDDHCADLGRSHPHWPVDRLRAEASKHVSPPSVAPHPCGAAVDLTLWAHGAELDLGTAMNATPQTSANACFTAAANITEQARHWRDVLAKAMAVGGMVNYPPEWWHWSYGDKYWAATTHAPAAHYAPR
jgi:zinc D-Ala-D-Ala dipeptidase